MRILHLCLANYYIDGYSYQENILPRINKENGHDVYIIASTETFIDNSTLGYVKPGKYMTEYGVPIRRLPYVKIVNRFVSAKLRKYIGLYDEICSFSPDIIFMHDICFGSVGEIADYKKNHPEVRLYADTHTAYYNSGTNWISMFFLHKLYYKSQKKKIVDRLEKYYYIGSNEKRFSMEVYGIPESLMEYYPLGGTLPSEEYYQESRKKKREEIQIKEDEILFLHTGKIDKKKKTADLLRAFHNVPALKAKLAIIGSIAPEIKEELETMIEADERVSCLGWKSAEELTEYLCAADYYCQPGSPSVTMQNAICHRCIVIAYPTEGYEALDYNNFIWTRNEEELEDVLERIAAGKVNKDDLLENTKKCAEELLDYRALAERYCKDCNH